MVKKVIFNVKKTWGVKGSVVSRPYRFSENIWLVEIFTRVKRKSKHSERKGIVWRVAKMGKVFGFEDKNRKVVDYSQNTEVKKPECGEIDGIGRCWCWCLYWKEARSANRREGWGGAAGQLVKVVKVEMPTSLQLPSAVTRIDWVAVNSIANIIISTTTTQQ